MPGDRVALTGLNSSRYLAVDIAIGLVGAVSVPLYYTTPPSDINDVLKASGAKLFFIGMPSLLVPNSRTYSRRTNSFNLPSSQYQRTTQRNVVSWEEFLAKGKDDTVPDQRLQ